jgi:hypothetical protein
MRLKLEEDHKRGGLRIVEAASEWRDRGLRDELLRSAVRPAHLAVALVVAKRMYRREALAFQFLCSWGLL